MEKLEADGKVFHKNCFRCEECKKAVGLGSFASLEGKVCATRPVFLKGLARQYR